MPVLPRALEIQGEIAAIRRDIHAHPELAYEENRTSDIVAAKLQEWGLEVTRGLGKTGLVGTLRKGNSLKSIGLRADMDCLPMDETNDFEHRSQNPGRMHACGHDGHTAMLLGAAKVLSEKRDFEGAVHFIFQPAEEGGGGGAGDDRRRPVREIPLRCRVRHPQQAGRSARPHRHQGPARCSPPPTAGTSASPARAAMPRTRISPSIPWWRAPISCWRCRPSSAATSIRIDSTVVTVGFFKAGSAYNVIPGDVHIGGTTRTTSPENRALVQRRIEEICDGAEQMHGVKIEIEHKPGYPPTVNNVEQRAFAIDVAAGVCGEHAVKDNVRPEHGRGGFLLHAGAGAGRHGDGWATAAAPTPSACTTRAMTSTTWPSRSASVSS